MDVQFRGAKMSGLSEAQYDEVVRRIKEAVGALLRMDRESTQAGDPTMLGEGCVITAYPATQKVEFTIGCMEYEVLPQYLKGDQEFGLQSHTYVIEET
jgi:hypothetical protein